MDRTGWRHRQARALLLQVSILNSMILNSMSQLHCSGRLGTLRLIPCFEFKWPRVLHGAFGKYPQYHHHHHQAQPLSGASAKSRARSRSLLSLSISLSLSLPLPLSLSLSPSFSGSLAPSIPRSLAPSLAPPIPPSLLPIQALPYCLRGEDLPLSPHDPVPPPFLHPLSRRRNLSSTSPRCRLGCLSPTRPALRSKASLYSGCM